MTVEPEVAERLLALNHQFYQTMGEDFSATRMRLQPGVRRILETIPHKATILDLGCGNGELARQLEKVGFSGSYTGLDNSQALLEIARTRIPGTPNYRLLSADISAPDWDAVLAAHPARLFDLVLAFSVLHHLPGQNLRLQVLGKVRQIIQPEGRFIHSQWQFLNSSRLRARIMPWEEIDLSSSQVDPGDYLLDWRRGGFGLRYVHHFSAAELDLLASAAGFQVSDSFLSDGERGSLGLYQVWTPAAA